MGNSIYSDQKCVLKVGGKLCNVVILVTRFWSKMDLAPFGLKLFIYIIKYLLPNGPPPPSHLLTVYMIRRGVRGWQGGGGQLPPMVLAFFFLLVSSVTYGDDDKIPLPHYGNNFVTNKNSVGKKNVSELSAFSGLAQCSARHFAIPPPPPPRKQTPWRRHTLTLPHINQYRVGKQIYKKQKYFYKRKQ